MRLYDKLMSQRNLAGLGFETFHERPEEALSNCVVIECSNVADFVYEKHLSETEKEFVVEIERPHLVLKEVFNAAPSYKKMFFEWKPPEIGGVTYSHVDYMKRVGVFHVEVELGQPIYEGLNAGIKETISELRHNHDGIRWIVVSIIVAEYLEYMNMAPYFMVTILDRDGKPIAQGGGHGQDDKKLFEMAIFHVNIAVCAQGMMHCKNIITRTNLPAKKLQKARNKRGKKPLIEFKTIHVDPKRISKRNENKSGVTGDTNRRHGMGGHFKDYRKGKGLFGKIKGVWYWGPQLRGDVMKGILLSDYRIDKKEDVSSR